MELVIAVIGWAGAGLLLAAYALASAERIAAGGPTFQVMNLLGAVALTVNSACHRAWPSAALNAAWIMIGLLVLSRRSLSAADPRSRAFWRCQAGIGPANVDRASSASIAASETPYHRTLRWKTDWNRLLITENRKSHSHSSQL